MGTVSPGWHAVRVASPFGRTVLIQGPESLLADRAVDERRARALSESPEAEIVDVEAARLDGGALAEMTSGSLFSSATVGVIRDLANLPSELTDRVLAIAQDTPDDLALILVHGGGVKGKGLIDKLKKAKVEVVEATAVKAWELPQFVEAEVRRAKGRIDRSAVPFLVEAVGHDLRAQSAAIAQLVADGDGKEINEALVRRYFGGRAEVTSFAVADAVLAGRTNTALEQLRWALSTGVAPVLVTSALANGLRGLGKLSGVRGGGMRDADVAREVGVPPWKLKSMRQQARGWNQGSLAQALRLVAQADADVKGAADDAEYALENCVLAIAQAREEAN